MARTRLEKPLSRILGPAPGFPGHELVLILDPSGKLELRAEKENRPSRCPKTATFDLLKLFEQASGDVVEVEGDERVGRLLTKLSTMDFSEARNPGYQCKVAVLAAVREVFQ